MSKWALIYQNRVIDLDDRDAPTPPNLPGAQWVQGKPGAAVGWLYAGNAVQSPPSPIFTRRLSWATLIDRLTDAEMDLILDNKGNGPFRRHLYRWETTGFLLPDQPQIIAIFRSIFGNQRASELLA